MTRLHTLLLALLGVSLFWCALIAEITLRFLPGNFIFLATLVFVACVSSGLLVYRFTQRNPNSVRKVGDQPNKGRPSGKKIEKGSGPTKKVSQATPGRQETSSKRNQTRNVSSSKVQQSGTRPSQSQTESSTATPRRQSKHRDNSDNRTSGRIKSYSTKQSYGFVVSDSGEQAFFHKTNLDPGVDDKALTKEQTVTFEVREGTRGPVATKIRVSP